MRQTVKCVICGEPATTWSGHVHAPGTQLRTANGRDTGVAGLCVAHDNWPIPHGIDVCGSRGCFGHMRFEQPRYYDGSPRPNRERI